MDKNEFIQQVANAYLHFYDLVYLRTHPLGSYLCSDDTLSRKEKARQIQHILEEVIKELDPGPQAPAFSREWRRHQLMVLRYLDGLEPQAVADELGISRRHYYREHEVVIEGIAGILWNRYAARPAGESRPAPPQEAQEAVGRLELMRLEAARMAQTNRYVQVNEVIQGVLSLLEEVLHQHKITLQPALADNLPDSPVDRNLLRNMLLGMLGYLIEPAFETTIRLTTRLDEAMAHLTVKIEVLPGEVQPAFKESRERLTPIEEMAALSRVEFETVTTGQVITGFNLRLPVVSRPTILVVDDNNDVLELFQRYLQPHSYRVVTAQTGREALALAKQLHPHAIILDLMMADQDGWDVLQILLNQVETRYIPIIVCSVLRQKEMALSLNAAAFLEKPFTEASLLLALRALAL